MTMFPLGKYEDGAAFVPETISPVEISDLQRLKILVKMLNEDEAILKQYKLIFTLNNSNEILVAPPINKVEITLSSPFKIHLECKKIIASRPFVVTKFGFVDNYNQLSRFERVYNESSTGKDVIFYYTCELDIPM